MTDLFLDNPTIIPGELKINNNVDNLYLNNNDNNNGLCIHYDPDQLYLRSIDINFLYNNIFENLCAENPEKEQEYRALLKLYRNNYRYTVLLIENENLKVEVEKINDIIR